MSDEPEPAGPRSRAVERTAGWEVPWTWADAAVAFLAGILLAELTRQLLALGLTPDLWRAVGPLVGSLALLLAVLGWVGLRHPGTLARLAGPDPPGARVVLLGLGHGLVAFLVLNLGFAQVFTYLARLLGIELPPVQETVREVITDPDIAIVGMLYVVLVAVVVEEVYFRGLLFQALRRPLGPWPAIGLSGLLFGLAHYQAGNPLGWLYTFVVMFPFGVYLAWTFNRYRTLVVPLLMHLLFNVLALVTILRGWG